MRWPRQNAWLQAKKRLATHGNERGAVARMMLDWIVEYKKVRIAHFRERMLAGEFSIPDASGSARLPR